MRGATIAFVALCALALGGCAIGHGSRPPSNHAYLDMYDRPPPRARKAKATVRASEPAELSATTGSAAPVAALKPYSPEWWAEERAREKRDNERLKRSLQICRGC